MRALAVIGAVFGVLLAALFWVQNSGRVTQLSFDVGFVAWELSQPVSIPVMVAVCLGAGVVVGAVAGWLGRGATKATPKPPSDASGSW